MGSVNVLLSNRPVAIVTSYVAELCSPFQFDD